MEAIGLFGRLTALTTGGVACSERLGDLGRVLGVCHEAGRPRSLDD